MAGPGHAAGMAGAGQEDRRKNAPTDFGTLAYEIVSDVDSGKIRGHGRNAVAQSAPGGAAAAASSPGRADEERRVNGQPWTDFDPAKERSRLHGIRRAVKVRGCVLSGCPGITPLSLVGQGRGEGENALIAPSPNLFRRERGP